MGVISKLINFINTRSQIQHTNLTNIMTKHGMFQAKMYKHSNQEYLVILSQNFFKVKAPIFYIHTDKHHCDSLEQFCGCSYPISVALKMLHKDGGLILYSSKEIENIDALLGEIHTTKLPSKNNITTSTNIKSALKGYRGEYLTIDFILKDLNISNVRLVSDNPNILFIMQQRQINILQQVSSISFEYGEQKINILEQISSIPFEYPKSENTTL